MKARNLVVAGALLGLVLPMGVAAPAAHAQGVTFIGFDDMPAKCLFSETKALRDRYSAVKFRGPDAKSGGAVLDTCSGLPFEPRTGDRVLAFNGSAMLSDGGLAGGPETMRLVTRPRVVEIWVTTGGSAGTFALKGKVDGKTVQRASVSVTQVGWVVLRVRNKNGLTSAVLSSDLNAWYADDLLLTD